jgi:hypothetical protein
VFELLAVGFIIDTPIDKQLKVREEFPHCLLGFLLEMLEIHLYPRGDPTDEGHILMDSFLHDGINLRFPVLYTVGFP